MPKHRKAQSLSSYRERAKKLNRLGYEFPLRGISPQRKGWITRTWEKKRYYITNAGENRVEFHRYTSRASPSVVRKYVSADQVTPGGYFVQRPKGVKRGKFSVRFGPRGMEVKSPKKINDLVIRLDSKAVLKDPKAAMERAMRGRRKPRSTRLVVNGFMGENVRGIQDFFAYFAELTTYLRREKRLPHAKISDIFQLKLIY